MFRVFFGFARVFFSLVHVGGGVGVGGAWFVVGGKLFCLHLFFVKLKNDIHIEA